ncbi:cap binding protein [Polyplosphaeria fusca]|uniref:Cap binding protein n=1 Tax=Polyplosphaeria fusca TaxID=682080 RepID=A0A9P4R3E3_9PLEO|nr:cap binding protein [Polyplosphaeria fusca]
MADVDVKQDGGDYKRRGRNNNRKRVYEDDDDDRDHYDRRGPPTQRRRHERSPRHRYEEPPRAKLRRLILNVASSAKLPEDEAAEIAAYLGEKYDEPGLVDDFFQLFIQLIIEQPFRIPVVAAVAFYGNYIKPEMTVDAVQAVAVKAQEALTAGNWRDFKQLLRCLACLQSVFEGEGVFALLRQLFDTVVDLQTANETDVVGIELVKIILLTIPYALVAGGDAFHDQARDLLKDTHIVAENMIPIEGMIAAYAGDTGAKPFEYHSLIGLLQKQLDSEAESGFELACILRFRPEVLRKEDSEEELLSAPPTLAFPAFDIPKPVNPGSKGVFPEAFFSVYANQETETVPNTTEIAGSLIRDVLVDTIDQLDFNREAVAKFLIDIDNYWAVNTFAKRGTAVDKLRENASDKAMWKSEDMLVDAIFSQMLKLPTPEHKLVYYYSIITQACKVAPAAIAPSLGRAIRFVYKNIDVMDVELVYRFLDWFAQHLSNFEFRWRWAEWANDTGLSNLHPKKAFIVAVLDKEIRLSFAKRIRATLPDAYHPLIPTSLDKDVPDFKYDNDQTPFAAEGKLLWQQFRKKEPDEVIQATIDEIHKKAEQFGIEDVLVPSTDAFVTAICRIGSKSLSHALSCVERGKERLMNIANSSDAARRQIVASVVEFWKDQPGVAVNLVDKLLNYTILQPITVVQWALEDHMGAGEALTQGWVYEMVSNTVAKVAKRNYQITESRLQKNLSQQQLEMVENAMMIGRTSSHELFKFIEDAVRGVAEGANEQLMEKQANGSLTEEEVLHLRAWAQRWYTTFERMAQVEKSVIGEEAIETKLKFMAAQPEPESHFEDVGNGMADGDGQV